MMDIPDGIYQKIKLISAIEGKSTEEVLLRLIEGGAAPAGGDAPTKFGKTRMNKSEQKELEELAEKQNSTPGQILLDCFRFTQMISDSLSGGAGNLIVLDSSDKVRFKTIPNEVEIIIHPLGNSI